MSLGQRGLKRCSSCCIAESQGFTLIEVLVALAILAIVAVTFLAAVGSNFKGASLAEERTTAESLARSQVEALKSAAYASSYTAGVSPNEGYTVAVTVTPIQAGLQKFRVTVSHQGREIIAVDDYKVAR